MDKNECHLLLAVFRVLAALRGSTCSVGFEFGKHTEGTLSSGRGTVNVFAHIHTQITHTHTLQRQGS